MSADPILTTLRALDVLRIVDPYSVGVPNNPGIVVDSGNPDTILGIQTKSGALVPLGGGGGASTFAGLSDKATADIPTINTPVATALSLLAPKANAALTGVPTAPTAAPGTTSTQLATTAFVNAAVTGLIDFKGPIDASANPNYPAGVVGDAYAINVAGKVGGAAGKSVDIGDMLVCSVNNAGGTEAAVGTSWFVLEHNLVGALQGANNLSDLANAATAWTNLGAAAKVLAQLLTGFSTGTKGAVTAADSVLAALGKLEATKAVPGQVTVVPLTTHTLVAADIGTEQQEQSTNAHTLSIDTTANSGIAWVAGKCFALGSVNTGAITLTALSGVTIVNIGSKAVVQDDTPLIVQMTPTLDRWQVL